MILCYVSCTHDLLGEQGAGGRNLGRWRYANERGKIASYSKTEYTCVTERKASGIVRLQRAEVDKVHDFKYQLFRAMGRVVKR